MPQGRFQPITLFFKLYKTVFFFNHTDILVGQKNVTAMIKLGIILACLQRSALRRQHYIDKI